METEFRIGQTVRTKGGTARTTHFEVVGLPVAHERDKAGNITKERDGRLHVRYKDNPSEIRHVDPALYEVVSEPEDGRRKGGKGAGEIGGEA